MTSQCFDIGSCLAAGFDVVVELLAIHDMGGRRGGGKRGPRLRVSDRRRIGCPRRNRRVHGIARDVFRACCWSQRVDELEPVATHHHADVERHLMVGEHEGYGHLLRSDLQRSVVIERLDTVSDRLIRAKTRRVDAYLGGYR